MEPQSSVNQPKISPGQVWVCDRNGSTPPLLCVVGMIDPHSQTRGEARIISLFVTPHPDAKKDGWPNVAHLPVLEDALKSSNLRLVKDNVQPGCRFESGYALWREKFDQGDAGVFEISISEAYAGIVSLLTDRDK